MRSEDIADFVASHVQDPLSRTPGVGDYQLFGSQYAMRIWLDSAKLNNYSLTPVDVGNAIRSQNVQVASGELGGLPSTPAQQLNATISGPSYLETPEQFAQILLRVEPNGAQVRLRDVARVSYGAEDYSYESRYNGHPAVAMAIKLESGANALDTVAAVKKTIAQLMYTSAPPNRSREPISLQIPVWLDCALGAVTSVALRLLRQKHPRVGRRYHQAPLKHAIRDRQPRNPKVIGMRGSISHNAWVAAINCLPRPMSSLEGTGSLGKAAATAGPGPVRLSHEP